MSKRRTSTTTKRKTDTSRKRRTSSKKATRRPKEPVTAGIDDLILPSAKALDTVRGKRKKTTDSTKKRGTAATQQKKRARRKKGNTDTTVVSTGGEVVSGGKRATKRRTSTTSSTEVRQRKTLGKRKMLGMGFSSPAALFVFLSGLPEYQTILIVKDSVPRSTVKAFLAERTAARKTVLVNKVSNLYKLGSKPKPKVCVAVCDVPEVLLSFGEQIETIDATENESGVAVLQKVKIADLVEALQKSGYGTPIHPRKLQRFMASFVATVPKTAEKTDGVKPLALIEDIVAGVRDDAKDRLQSSLFLFMAGILTHGKMSGVRRWALNRLAAGKDLVEHKQMFADYQCWATSDDGGRRVAMAYQSACRRKVKPALAAGRFDVDINVLSALFTQSPPSRNAEFPGWEYIPSEGD